MARNPVIIHLRYLLDTLKTLKFLLLYPCQNNICFLKLLVITIIVFSCRKAKDSKSPEIEIISPAIQSSYLYNQDLPIKISFHDDQQLDVLQIELVGTIDNRVFAATTLYPNNASYVYDQNIPLNDRYWPEGKMFVRVTASDGFNTSTQIQEFNYGEAPLTIDDEWRIIQSGATYSIFNLQDQLIFSNNKVYALGGYEPRSGKYWLAHSDGTCLNRTINDDFNETTFNLGTTPLTSYYDEEREQYFIGGANGSIWKWQNGNTQSYGDADNKRVRQIAATQQHLFAWKEDPVTGQDFINVYFIESGTLMNSVIAAYDIASIVRFDDELILLAGNQNGTSLFGFLQSNSESIMQNYSLTEVTPVQHLWPALDGWIWALHDAGLIRYDANLSGMLFASGIEPLKIIIDRVQQQYKIITSSGVYLIDAQFNIVGFTSYNNIADYFILYNK